MPEVPERHDRLRRNGPAEVDDVVVVRQLGERRHGLRHERLGLTAEHHSHRAIGRVFSTSTTVRRNSRAATAQQCGPPTQAVRHSKRRFWKKQENQKIDVARVFERIFEIYKDQFTLLIPAALLVFVPVALISGLIYAGDMSIIGGLIVAAAIATIATYWFQGMVVEAARDILDGRRDHSIGSLVQSVTPVLGPLIIAGILAGIGIGIGQLLTIVPGLFLLTIWP